MKMKPQTLRTQTVKAMVVSFLLVAAATVVSAADAPTPSSPTPPSGPYTLRAGHPRIFADAESFRRIEAQCGKGGSLESSYRALVTMLDPRMNPKNAYYPRNYCGPLFGFAYRIETDLGRDGSRFLQHLKQVCWKPDGSGIDGMDFGWDAIIYDWVYDALTPEERTLYGNRIGRFLRLYTKVPVITLEGGTYWYNQTWGGAMCISWCRDGIAPKTMVALAIAGEKTDYQEDARRWLDSFATRMPEEFVKKFDQLGGVWPEGPNHGSVCFAPFITWEAWRFATGQDLFGKVARTGFHREAPYWPVYGTVPHTGHMPHMEDVGPGMFYGLDVSMFRGMHAAHYRDGISQGVVRSAVEKGRAGWADMIWYDPSVPVVKKEALPLALHHFVLILKPNGVWGNRGKGEGANEVHCAGEFGPDKPSGPTASSFALEWTDGPTHFQDILMVLRKGKYKGSYWNEGYEDKDLRAGLDLMTRWPDQTLPKGSDHISLLLCFRDDLNGHQAAAAYANDYRSPDRLNVSEGVLDTLDEGDRDADGFNEAEGCYVLNSTAKGVRFTLHGAKVQRMQPAFKVKGWKGSGTPRLTMDGLPLALGADFQVSVDGGVLLLTLARIVNNDVSVSITAQESKPAPEEAKAPASEARLAPDGLAALYPGDEGIERDPRVLFVDDFETGDFKETVARWGDGRVEGRVAHAEDVPSGSPGRRSVRIRFGHLYTHFRPADRVHVRYYIKFHPDCGYTHHLPFLLADRVPTPWPKGFAGKKPGGDQFFGSALDAWGDWGKLPPPGKWMLYSYWQEMKKSGDGMYWGNSFEAPQEPIERGRWYCLEMMIRANSTPEAADGEQAFWVDGKLVGLFKGMRWRSTDKLKLNSFWLLHDGETGSTLHADKEHAKRVYDLWFDDLVIAMEYIGPVQGKPKEGKKIGVPSRSAMLTGELSVAPGKRIFSEKFEAGAGAFKGAKATDGALAVEPRGADVFGAYSTSVQNSTTIRFRVKPTAEVSDAQVLVWSDKLMDNARSFLHGLKKGEWTAVEIRPIEMCAGWSQDGPSLDGCVMDNFKVFFTGDKNARLLLDDFEVFE